jgi:hypothetical protein
MSNLKLRGLCLFFGDVHELYDGFYTKSKTNYEEISAASAKYLMSAVKRNYKIKKFKSNNVFTTHTYF